MPDPFSPRDLRVSDDERRHVVELLQSATGRGLLDLDEFSTRVDAALAARTRGELNAVLVDLPGLVHPEDPVRRAVAVPVQHHHPAPVAAAGEGPVISVEFSSAKRRGAWAVPERLTVRAVMGSVELDFTATAVPPVVVVDLSVTAGSVELRVPEGSVVEQHDVQLLLASVDVGKRVRSAAGDGPRFVLRGAVRAGSVEVKGPKRRGLLGR